MKNSNLIVTPSLLVLIVAPVLFLLAPDGIPCVYAAGCTSGISAANSPTVDLAATCGATQGSTENIFVSNISLVGGGNQCELTASVDVHITGDSNCDAVWYKYCSTVTLPCSGPVKAIDGPVSTTRISTSHRCQGT